MEEQERANTAQHSVEASINNINNNNTDNNNNNNNNNHNHNSNPTLEETEVVPNNIHLASSLSTVPKSAASKMTSAVLAIRERRNWLIHQLYIRQEYTECLSIIESQLQECEGVCEYALYVKGLLMRRNGKLEESFNLFQTALFINPQNPVNQKQVAQSLMLLGQHQAAIEAYRDAEHIRLVKGGGDDWSLQYNMGICYMYLKDYKQAEVSFVKSISIQRHDCCVMQLGKALVMQKEYERAIALYEEALQSSPENPDLLTAVGLLYLQLGKTPKAFNYVAKCLTLNSSNPTAIMAAAGVMQENGDFSVALHKYRVAVPQLSHSARLWSNIGMCFFGQQNMHAAVACLRKAVALAPFEWRITYNIGLVFLHLRQLASAFHYLAATTHLQPHYAPAYMHLGVCLALMNDTVNASAAYKRALAIDQDLLILLNYTITLVNAGNMEEGRRQMEGFMRVWAHKDKRERMEWGPVFLRTVNLLNMRLSIGNGMNDLNNICKKKSSDDDDNVDKVYSNSSSSSSSSSTNSINGEDKNSKNTIEVEAKGVSSDEVKNNNV